VVRRFGSQWRASRDRSSRFRRQPPSAVADRARTPNRGGAATAMRWPTPGRARWAESSLAPTEVPMPVSRALRRARSPIGGGQTGAYPTARPSRPSPFLVRWDLWHFGTITRPSERPKVMCCPPDQLVHRNSQFAGARSGCDLAGCGSLWSYSMTDLAASTRRSPRRSTPRPWSRSRPG